MLSKHPLTNCLLNSGLFDRLNSFADLEAGFSALPSNKERGDAFEIFAEAYLATQKIAQAQEVWPFEAIPLKQRTDAPSSNSLPYCTGQCSAIDIFSVADFQYDDQQELVFDAVDNPVNAAAHPAHIVITLQSPCASGPRF